MSAANPSIDFTDGLAGTGEFNSRRSLKCRLSDCKEDQEFSTEVALRKHEDKHNRPYVCTVLGCKHPRFGDKGGLDRHAREVHGNATHYCPIPSCKRHTRGFPRKYNLFEHQKRCHPGQSPSTTSALVCTSHTQVMKVGEEIYTSDEEDGEVSTLGTMHTEGVARGGNEILYEKLRRLKKERAEIDRNIRAVERVLDLI
ncbi:hypothetical protein N431DRAFT_337096 [Stipitochalara longipes BDJ]|nr:hypothetical protein N431DRAFT_337096 [Stipitochalara longipes BDJ]